MLTNNGLPVITIHSSEPAATPPANTAILCSKLRDALVRFDEINVVYDVPAVGSVDLPSRESGDAIERYRSHEGDR